MLQQVYFSYECQGNIQISCSKIFEDILAKSLNGNQFIPLTYLTQLVVVVLGLRVPDRTLEDVTSQPQAQLKIGIDQLSEPKAS